MDFKVFGVSHSVVQTVQINQIAHAHAHAHAPLSWVFLAIAVVGTKLETLLICNTASSSASTPQVGLPAAWSKHRRRNYPGYLRCEVVSTAADKVDTNSWRPVRPLLWPRASQLSNSSRPPPLTADSMPFLFSSFRFDDVVS